MKNTSFSRFWLIGGTLTLAGLFIFIWMVRLMSDENAQELIRRGTLYKTKTVTILPARGVVYDKWGHVLAGNAEVYEIHADLRYVSDEDQLYIADTLSYVLGLDRGYVVSKLNPQPMDGVTPYYVLIEDFIPVEKITELQAIEVEQQKQAEKANRRRGDNELPSLYGLIYSPHLLRTYPEGTLAANILGFYNFKDRDTPRGFAGIEESFNQLLSGEIISKKVPIDPHLIGESETETIPPGASLILTIDRDIQAMAERIADQAMENTGSKSATILIMDPETGEIMAMAVNPRMDPNEYWTFSDVFQGSTPYNRAIGLTYEPGSVFKVLTMAAALDSGTVVPTTPFLDTGVYYIGGVGLHNWDGNAWGPQDMLGCMQHSLNVCLAWVADQMGPTVFYSYLEKFGIGHTTGVDLAGEVSSPLSVQGDSNWYAVNLGTNAFGQGVAVSPLQMVAAVAAVANDGKMMMPHVLKAVIDNGEQYKNPPQVIGTPISADTAHTLTEMLVTSLTEESSSALVEGYAIAGKTGTASIPGPNGYLNNATNASFVGWGPADDPKFIVYVWLEEPETSEWGSVVASPVFSQVVSELVVLMDLPPDEIRKQIAGN